MPETQCFLRLNYKITISYKYCSSTTKHLWLKKKKVSLWKKEKEKKKGGLWTTE